MLDMRRLVAEFDTPEALRDALLVFVAENSAEAYVLYRELDYFEQLGASSSTAASTSSSSGPCSAGG